MALWLTSCPTANATGGRRSHPRMSRLARAATCADMADPPRPTGEAPPLKRRVKAARVTGPSSGYGSISIDSFAASPPKSSLKSSFAHTMQCTGCARRSGTRAREPGRARRPRRSRGAPNERRGRRRVARGPATSEVARAPPPPPARQHDRRARARAARRLSGRRDARARRRREMRRARDQTGLPTVPPEDARWARAARGEPSRLLFCAVGRVACSLTLSGVARIVQSGYVLGVTFGRHS